MTASNPYAGLIERLRRQAERMSEISRQMAEAKSLRQEDNTERSTDLYSWATPEQTTEWQAAEALSRLTRDVEEAKEALEWALGVAASVVEMGDPGYEQACAALTRLSRPPDLGADPALAVPAKPASGLDASRCDPGELYEAASICLKAERERQAKLKPNSPASTYTARRIAQIEAALAKAEGANQ